MYRMLISLMVVMGMITGFTTPSFAQETGSFTDNRDSKVYKTVNIGDQWWMAENLAFKTDAGCWFYEDIEGYVDTHGYLYAWETANKVCPDGWHLPSDSEFEKLSNFLGGPDAAGGKLKETGTAHWNSPNAGATNSSGFTARSSGTSIDFEHKIYLGLIAYFCSSEDDGDLMIGRALYSAKGEFTRYGLSKEDGYSVRCIKD